jgi:chitin synthase
VYQFFQLVFTYLGLVSRADDKKALHLLTRSLQANFYLVFYFIAGSLANPTIDPFGHHIGLYIFYILRYACVLLICLQFILSMGNRPQG